MKLPQIVLEAGFALIRPDPEFRPKRWHIFEIAQRGGLPSYIFDFYVPQEFERKRRSPKERLNVRCH
jgi:hypothetical protein